MPSFCDTFCLWVAKKLYLLSVPENELVFVNNKLVTIIQTKTGKDELLCQHFLLCKLKTHYSGIKYIT